MPLPVDQKKHSRSTSTTLTQATKPITMEARQVRTAEMTATRIWTRVREEEPSKISLATRCLTQLQEEHPRPGLNSSKASARILSQVIRWEEAHRACQTGTLTHSLEVTTSSNNSNRSPPQQPPVTSSETASPRSPQLRRLQVEPLHSSMSEAD